MDIVMPNKISQRRLKHRLQHYLFLLSALELLLYVNFLIGISKSVCLQKLDHVLEAVWPAPVSCDRMPGTRRNICLASTRGGRVKCRQGRGVLIRRIEAVTATEDEVMLTVDNVNWSSKFRRWRNDTGHREQDS